MTHGGASGNCFLAKSGFARHCGAFQFRLGGGDREKITAVFLDRVHDVQARGKDNPLWSDEFRQCGDCAPVGPTDTSAEGH